MSYAATSFWKQLKGLATETVTLTTTTRNNYGELSPATGTPFNAYVQRVTASSHGADTEQRDVEWVAYIPGVTGTGWTTDDLITFPGNVQRRIRKVDYRFDQYGLQCAVVHAGASG